MSLSAIGSGPSLAAPVSLPPDNEAVEKAADNEAAEAPQRFSLKEGQGTRIDLSV